MREVWVSARRIQPHTLKPRKNALMSSHGVLQLNMWILIMMQCGRHFCLSDKLRRVIFLMDSGKSRFSTASSQKVENKLPKCCLLMAFGIYFIVITWLKRFNTLHHDPSINAPAARKSFAIEGTFWGSFEMIFDGCLRAAIVINSRS